MHSEVKASIKTLLATLETLAVTNAQQTAFRETRVQLERTIRLDAENPQNTID